MFFIRIALPLLLLISLVLEGGAAWAVASPAAAAPAKVETAPAGAEKKAPGRNATASRTADADTAASAASGAPKPAAGKKSSPKTSTGKSSRDKTGPHANARHMGDALGAGSSWYLDGSSNKARGPVWEQGVPMENLMRKRTATRSGASTPSGTTLRSDTEQRPSSAAPRSGATADEPRSAAASVDTKKGIDSALGAISTYERPPADGSALGLNKPGAPSLQMTTEEASWRNPVTQPPSVGQEVMTTRRNVVGAYADVVKNDDLHVTLGPELHIPESDPTVKRLTPHQNDSSTLGIGMKWQWDF